MQVSGDELGSKTSLDFTKRRGAMHIPTKQSRAIKRFSKFVFMEEITIFRALMFVARMKSAPKHPNT